MNKSSVTALCCVLLVGFCLSGIAQEAENGKVEKIIKGYLDAIGGQEALLAVNTLSSTINVNMVNRPPYDNVITCKDGDKIRLQQPGSERRTVVSGSSGWSITGSESQELPQEAIVALGRKADFYGPFINTAQKGISIEYAGKERFEFLQLECLKVNYANGDHEIWCLDSRTSLPRVIKKPSLLMAGGKFVKGPQNLTYLFDYRVVNGVKFPFSWVQTDEKLGHVHSFFVKEIKVNFPCTDSYFAPPGSAEQEK